LSSVSSCTQLELFQPELALRKLSASYHVSFDGAYYSAPHHLYNETVIVRATKDSIDILNSYGQCVASHIRSYTRRQYVTDPSHLPDVHNSVFYDGRFDGARLRSWAKCFGNNTFQVIDTMLIRKTFEEHAFRSCMAVLQISKKYGPFILESACRLAISAGLYNFSAIQKLAKAEYDRVHKK